MHTPGPWKVSRGSGNSEQVISVDAADHAICRIIVNNGARRLPEAPANARLIAAAPKLLEALEAIINIAEPTAGTGFTVSGSSIHQARTAIDAAKEE